MRRASKWICTPPTPTCSEAFSALDIASIHCTHRNGFCISSKLPSVTANIRIHMSHTCIVHRLECDTKESDERLKIKCTETMYGKLYFTLCFFFQEQGPPFNIHLLTLMRHRFLLFTDQPDWKDKRRNTGTDNRI